jgi:hypothetical protein
MWEAPDQLSERSKAKSGKNGSEWGNRDIPDSGTVAAMALFQRWFGGEPHDPSATNEQPQDRKGRKK